MERKNFDYDNFSDRLIISRKNSDERVHGSVEIGNLILDFTANGKLVNVEIKQASKFLETIKMNPKILDELTDAKVLINAQKNALLIFAVLKTQELEQPISLGMIPVSTRLSKSA